MGIEIVRPHLRKLSFENDSNKEIFLAGLCADSKKRISQTCRTFVSMVLNTSIDYKTYLLSCFYLNETIVPTKGTVDMPSEFKTDEALDFECIFENQPKIVVVTKTIGPYGNMFGILPQDVYEQTKQTYCHLVNKSKIPLIRINQEGYHPEDGYYQYYVAKPA